MELVAVLAFLAAGGLLLAGLIVVWLVFKILGWVILLPLRIVGFALIVPLLLIKLVLGLVVGLAVVPVMLVGLLGALAASLLFSWLPLIFIGVLLWMMVSLFSRPAVSPH